MSKARGVESISFFAPLAFSCMFLALIALTLGEALYTRQQVYFDVRARCAVYNEALARSEWPSSIKTINLQVKMGEECTKESQGL